MIRAAVYCRISHDPRGRALGVERQRQDCLAIAERKGWRIVDEYIDNDAPASKYSRKARREYLRLLSDIEAGKIDAVIIWMEDRLQRQVIELAEFLKICEKAKVTKIASVGGEFDLADPDQRTMLYIKAAMAEAEVEKLRSRAQRQRLQAAEKGEPNSGGRRGFGFRGRKRLPDGTTVPAVSLAQARREQALTREAVDSILAGGTLYGIAVDWKEHGVRTPSGNLWSSQNIRQMLLSPSIAGYRTYHGTLMEAAWEPIVPRERWEALKTFLEDPARAKGKRGRPPAHLLTGLVFCGLCGRPMGCGYHGIRADGRRVRQYKCRSGVGWGGCSRITRSADRLEELITEALFVAVEGPTFEQQMQQAAAHSDDPAAELYRKLMTDRALLDRLEDHLGDGLLTPDAYRRQRARIEERMEAAREELASVQSHHAIASVPTNLREVWPSLSLDRKRAILKAVLNRITVNPQQGAAFDPGAIPGFRS